MPYILQSEPAIPPTIPHHQVFLVESPPNHHKLLIQASPASSTDSFFAHVIFTPDLSQVLMTFVEDVVSALTSGPALFAARHLGSVAPDALDRLRSTCRSTPPPNKPSGENEDDEEAERGRRGQEWVQQTIQKLLAEQILQPPDVRSLTHQLPRHHHTQYCTHQRLHCHHPYRRRGRQQELDNAGLDPAATVQDR
ncbi:hypothetical protein B0T10DRAFT_63394 [Thelonectria olida]|uniref:Uncharacterized protein n=1 Tax=Thelonectria olida TaxID=1576542 RepID=A0A9P9APC2_9HYPO|nr:hypothetical protein B0T10DRAFT_63394 [Thelonectria olida]